MSNITEEERRLFRPILVFSYEYFKSRKIGQLKRLQWLNKRKHELFLKRKQLLEEEEEFQLEKKYQTHFEDQKLKHKSSEEEYDKKTTLLHLLEYQRLSQICLSNIKAKNPKQ